MTSALPEVLEKLEPCPFCGDKPILRVPERTDGFAMHVWCRCGAQLWGRKHHFSSQSEAITAWNTRPALLRDAGDASDSARLNWLCSGGLKMVENTFRAGYRVYLDTAPPDHEHAHWQAMTGDFYASAREAIDAAMHAPGGATGEQ